MATPTPSSTKPLVLVSCDLKSFDGYQWHAAIDTYARAVALASGCAPVLMPALGALSAADSLLEAAHGIVFTGARSNVHPENYGTKATDDHEPFDAARDETTLPMILRAVERGVPLLAICRGHQELNVAFGGTIDAEIQTIEGRLDHRGGPSDAPVDHRFRPKHPVALRPGGPLEAAIGEREIVVNSVHRQAIGRLGDGLTAEATAPDDTIEAISVTDATGFTLGVQWHPEHWACQSLEADAPSTAIFRAFGEAAAAYKGANA
ncbi:MAG: gamma-glutamyl-gamma-aminobutyrate hydrolase family protein [Devosiaceae bacterium]|nr:gamma-glutamyl-gamma-aminobutyrate hydrolase family protein [Devosiaceae bacterium MH13]